MRLDKIFIRLAVAARDEFREEQHPRAENGQFTSAGGGSSSGSGSGDDDKKSGELKNKSGKAISIDERLTGRTRQVLEYLCGEYDTRLERVALGQAAIGPPAAGSVTMSGSDMKISSKHPDTALHEFAHTLANSRADKYGLTHDQEFWKEIKAIRRAYKKDVDRSGDTRRWISSYEHSQTKEDAVDEFLAEAFTHAKAREMGIELPGRYGTDYTYSQQVLEAVNRHFKRRNKR